MYSLFALPSLLIRLQDNPQRRGHRTISRTVGLTLSPAQVVVQLVVLGPFYLISLSF
jgi:hypothetical protein